jgi:pre-mRNA-splicing factor CWC26
MLDNILCFVLCYYFVISNNLILLVNVDEEKPVVDEDIEVKRMKRLEQLKARRSYHDISEDGSGWIPLSSKSENPGDSNDMSPPRKQRVRNDTPSPEPEINHSTSNKTGADLSPSRRRLKRKDTPSPERDSQLAHSEGLNSDLSPPRKHRDQIAREPRLSKSRFEDSDISPPRRQHTEDLSPPRRGRHDSPSQDTLHGTVSSDLSPPRKRQHSVARSSLSDVSRRSHPSFDHDLSPPRKKSKELSIPASVNERKTGLISGKDISEEIDKKKKEDLLR